MATANWVPDGPSRNFPTGTDPGVDDQKGAELTNGVLQELAYAARSIRTIMNLTQHDRVTISGADNTATVVFATPYPDTNYHVWMGCGIGAGSPVAESLIPSWSSKLTTGFTIQLYTNPGTGASVIVEWVATGHLP